MKRKVHILNRFRKAELYLKLIWNHVVFWSFPTPEEDYYLRLGTIYFHLEKYRKAISLLEKSEKAHNYQDSTYSRYNCFYLGYCYLNLGNFKRTIECFERYLKFKKDPELLEYISSCYISINRPLNALETCLQGTKLEPDSSAWNIYCARILMELNRKDEALEHLKLAEEKVKDTHEKNIINSLEYKLEGHLGKAIETVKDMISGLDASLNTLMRQQKAHCYMIMKQYQREINDQQGVLDSLKQAFKNKPTDMWIINELAMEYADQEIMLDEALALANKALLYQPDNSIFMDTKGWILFKMGKIQEAKAEIGRSLSLNPENKDANEHYKLIDK